MSERDRDIVVIGHHRMGKSFAMALAVQKMRATGINVMVMDGPGLVVPIERDPDVDEAPSIRARPKRTHPNSPMATRRSWR